MTQTGRLYGGSLYDLAAEEQLTDIYLEEMQAIRRLFQDNPEYVSLLSEPSLAKEERLGLIETAFGKQAQRYLVNFLKILCERGLLKEFAGCTEEFTRRYNQDHGIAEAIVTSAVELNKSQIKALKERLEKMSGKKVSLSFRKDPSVVAGLRVELEGKQLDGTVQGRMNDLSGRIKNVVV